MPNWVYNEVEVRGDNLQDFYNKHIVDGEFDFSTIIPIPLSDDEYHGTDILTLNNGGQYRTGGVWYEWNTDNWGTKWNARDTQTDSLVENGFVSFQTAWSPPLPVMDALAKMYPNLDFDYKFVEEQGWGGVREYSDGTKQITKTRDWDIPTTHKERIEIFDYCYACEFEEDEEMEEFGCPR